MSTEIENSIEQESFALRSDLHLTRKLWHMCTGLIGLSIYSSLGLSSDEMAWALLSLALSAIAVEITRLKVPSVNRVVLKVMKPFMRESEKDSMSGFPFYALGVSLALLMYSEKIAVLAALFLMFSDPISSLFGILYGRDKIIGNKSLQGAMAGFVVCYVLTFLYGSYYYRPGVELLVFSLIAGVIGSVSELCSILVDDNLTIPIVSGLGLTLLNFIIPIF
jgi:dolichol kinase